MKDLIPRDVVIQHFVGIMAISPAIYSKIVASLAKEYSVDAIKLSEFIIKVLQELPPQNWDDF